MAWFVVLSGLLLFAGGAASLLLGFDIVMTERGAAMAIGGVVALSGGVIAIGIGFALFRLKQILRALEGRTAKAPRPAASDRPVVPSPAEPAPSEAAVGVGGIAAGAAIGASAAAILPPLRETPESASPPASPMPPAFDDAMSALCADEAAEAASTDMPRPAPPDLEEELSRALAEADEPTPPRRSVVGDDGHWLERDLSDPPAGTNVAHASVPDLDGEPPAPTEADADFDATDAADMAAQPEIGVELADAGPDAPMEEAEPSADAASPAAEAPLQTAAPAQPAVLGTYSVGGKTYRMFADGSVEAMTEFGVERFASMDELRKHLASP